jgi:hypothetical protein
MMVTNIQNDAQKTRWRQKNIFSLKNQLERHLSGYSKTVFACKMFSFDRNKIFSHLNTTAEIQDGVKLQNGAQKMKKS